MLHDSFVDPAEGGKWKLRTDRQAGFDIPKDAPYHTVMVPTSATVHNQFLIRVVTEQGFNTCPTAPRVRRRSPPSRACCGRASTRTSAARWLSLLGPDSGEPVPGHHLPLFVVHTKSTLAELTTPMALAPTDVSKSVSAASFGDRDLVASAVGLSLWPGLRRRTLRASRPT